MRPDNDAKSRASARASHANGAGHGAPASERVGESEGRSLSDDLEALAHRELQRLPPPRAPHTLLPRVMAAVDAWARRPWYTRAWFTWPVGWQIVSVALVAAFAYGAWHVPSAPPSVKAAAGASRAIWDVVVQPLLPYLLLVVVLMCAACALVGMALNYVLLERVEERR
jgi:hypothetical protein